MVRSTYTCTKCPAAAANGSPAPLFESDEDRLSFVIRLPCHPLARPVPPKVTGEVAPEVTPEVAPEVVRVVLALQEELSRTGLQQALDLCDEYGCQIVLKDIEDELPEDWQRIKPIYKYDF